MARDGFAVSPRQIALAVVLWVAIFAVFVVIAGIDDFLDAAAAISPLEFGTMLLAVGVGAVAMGTTLYVLSRSLDIDLGWLETILLNTAVSFCHNVTPFGQAGGVPLGALILSRRAGGSYERALAVLTAKDVVSFVPPVLVLLVSGPYLAVYEPTVPAELRPVFAAFGVVVVGVCAIAGAILRFPDRTRDLLHRLVGTLNRALGAIPKVPQIPEDSLQRRVDEFSDSIGQLAADRRTIVAASALTTTSFVVQGLLLWYTLVAVGVTVPIPLAVFAVPVSLLASGLPLPGGSGGVEAVQILIVSSTVDASLSLIITGVVLSRGLVYWTPIVIGSLTLVTMGVDEAAG